MSTIKANTLLHSDGSTTTQPSIPALDTRMAKAWVNLNGDNTIAINDAYNVSSLTDDGTGDYVINFATNMANVNFAVACSASDASFSTANMMANGYEYRVNYIKIGTFDHGGTARDLGATCVIVMGGS